MEKAADNLKEALELYFEDKDAETHSDDVLITVIDIPNKAKVRT